MAYNKAKAEKNGSNGKIMKRSNCGNWGLMRILSSGCMATIGKHLKLKEIIDIGILNKIL